MEVEITASTYNSSLLSTVFHGQIGSYKFRVNVRDKHKPYGLYGGCLSEILIADDDNIFADYYRSWYRRPETDEQKEALTIIIKKWNGGCVD